MGAARSRNRSLDPHYIVSVPCFGTMAILLTEKKLTLHCVTYPAALRLGGADRDSRGTSSTEAGAPLVVRSVLRRGKICRRHHPESSGCYDPQQGM